MRGAEMANLYNNKPVLGVNGVGDAVKLHNNQPVAGVYVLGSGLVDDAVTAAEAAAAIAQSGTDVSVAAFSELASRLRYSGATGDQINVSAGMYLRDRSTGAIYQVLASGAAGGDLDYTGAGGVKLGVIPIRGMVTPMMFGALPRFAGTTGRATSTDCSAQMQAAINYVAARNATAGVSRCELLIDDYYAATGLTLPTGATVRQICPPYIGGIICPDGAPSGDIMAISDPEALRVSVKGLFINGNAGAQTNTQRGFVIDISATSNTATLRDFVIEDLTVHNTTGRGVHVSAYTRRSTFRGIRSYFAGEVGFFYAGSDCSLYDFDVGQSVSTGFQCQASAGKISTGKVWGSGRYQAGSTATGCLWETGNCIIDNVEAQENAGRGHHFFKSGSTLRGIVATITADANDVGGAGLESVAFFNVQNSRFEIYAGKLNAGLAGNPSTGVSVAGGSIGNVFDLTSSGLTSWPWVIAAGSEDNDFRNNGNRLVTQNIPVNGTPNPYAEGGWQGALTADTTINNPSRKPRGFKLRFVIQQAAGASYNLTWGSDFAVRTPFNRAPGAVTVFDFISDGSIWRDVGANGAIQHRTETAERTLTADDSGLTIDNDGASSLVTFVLPTARQGHVFEFVVLSANGIRVSAPSGHTIRVGASVSASAGRIDSTTVGSAVRLIKGSGNQWVAATTVGTWAVT